jgi:ABC-2 type transport system ATP-binding protein
MEITIENLTKKYGEQKAVDSISFQLKSGEVLGFLGPNGAGKSTTMKIISCFMAPSSGNVLVNNQSVFEHTEDFKRKIGYLPENNPLYLDMYIHDYLNFMASLQGIEKSKIHTRVREIIEYTGLGDEQHKKIGELSKGYKQRVGLAQALVHDPEVLILDEPTSGLDPNQIIEIRELIKNLGKEKTILLSTHILQEVEATCDRIIIINKGKIAADSTPDQLQMQMQTGSLIRLKLEAKQSIDQVSNALKKVPSITDIHVIDDKNFLYQLQSNAAYESKKAVFDLCVSKGWYILEMKENEAKLEDIFRKLTASN